MDFQQIKRNNPIESVVVKYLGEANKDDWWWCPFHKEESPSFHLYERNNQKRFKCFGCKAQGDVVDFIKKLFDIGTREAMTKLTNTTFEPAPPPRGNVKTKIPAPVNLKKRTIKYHAQVSNSIAQAYWSSQGVTPTAIDHFKLGWAPRCPTLPVKYEGNTASVTIPYLNQGAVTNLKHRLIVPNGYGKYRYETKGLKNQLFNLDTLYREEEFEYLLPSELLIIEGEIKPMVVDYINGFRAIGIPGASSWQTQWASLIPKEKIKQIYIGLDPGVEQDIINKIAADLHGQGFAMNILSLLCKPDDMFVRYGANASDFMAIIKQSRKYGG